jgi:hypothetical protein
MDLDSFLKMMAKSNLHRNLYHFTDTRNIESIREIGLVAMAEARRRKIEIIAPGGNEWSQDADLMSDMDEYVHLCLTDDHPMAYRAQEKGHVLEVAYLKIDPEVMRLEGVLMSDGVANKSDVEHLPLEDMLPKLDYEVLYKNTNWSDPEIKERRKIAKKFEILVPKSILPKYIRFPHG